MSTKRIITGAFLASLLTLGMAAPASAQLGINFSKHGRRSHVGFGINFGGGCRPVHHHSACCVQQHPGHWEVQHERVWVAGCPQRVWVEAEYRWECDPCGNQRQVLVRPGFWNEVPGPGHWETVERRVWVAGHTQYVCGY